MIKVQKASFAYDHLSPWVIRDCSIELASPGLHLVTGGNGSGKSTFMDMISGFKKPANGCISINNVDLYSSQRSVSSLRRIMSYMPSSIRMPLYLDVSYILNMWMGGYFRDELIRELNLAPFMGHKYFSLSDGYRHRVHLAVALSRGAYVLLDEPLKSQDDELRSAFPRLVSRFSKGRTLVVTSPNIIEGIRWDSELTINGGELK